jgi:ethanolamine utilization protein EutA
MRGGGAPHGVDAGRVRLRRSEDIARPGIPILNIDIGGGTTKLALVEDGKVLHTAAIHIGGRLAVFDADGRITRLDSRRQRLASLAGCAWKLGDKVSAADIERVTSWMADALVAALTMESPSPDVQTLWLTEPLDSLRSLAASRMAVMFSGGVGEYVYEREARDFGDLGLRLGHAVRQRLESGRLPFNLLPAGECIRATALGASEYSVQLSGNTIYLSSPGSLLPRKNLQVLQPPIVFGALVDPEDISAAVRDHLQRFDIAEGRL